jgi:hypothetical protein
MKTYMNKSLGQTVPVQVPSNAEEFDQLAGRTGACVDEANRNVIYRGWNHAFREAFCDALEQETGIEREGEDQGEGDKKKFVYTEKEQPYINRLLSTGAISEEAMQQIASTVGEGIKFDPSPSTRSKKAPKEIVALVDNAFIAIEDDGHALTEEKFAGNLAQRLGIDTFESQFGELTKESAITALQAIKEKEQRERESSLLG